MLTRCSGCKSEPVCDPKPKVICHVPWSLISQYFHCCSVAYSHFLENQSRGEAAIRAQKAANNRKIAQTPANLKSALWVGSYQEFYVLLSLLPGVFVEQTQSMLLWTFSRRTFGLKRPCRVYIWYWWRPGQTRVRPWSREWKPWNMCRMMASHLASESWRSWLRQQPHCSISHVCMPVFSADCTCATL